MIGARFEKTKYRRTARRRRTRMNRRGGPELALSKVEGCPPFCSEDNMENILPCADELGPIKIVHLYDPKCDLKAVVAIDNVARGPAIGGIRMAPDVSAEEAFRLARAMTMKNSAAGLPPCGRKSVIFGDPKMETAKKK